MKLGRALLVSLVAASSVACSDPPSAPAEGAAWIRVEQETSGSTCQAQHTLTFPVEARLIAELECDLTQEGCNPAEFVAVDGDTNSAVSCNVTPASNGFSVNGRIQFNFDTLGVNATVSEEGNSLGNIAHYWQVPGGAGASFNLAGEGCSISFPTNKSALAGGRVWAQFTCPKFTDKSVPGGLECSARGAFLFQKCGGS